MNVYFDIETNALSDWIHLSDLNELFCIVACVEGDEPKRYTPEEFKKLVKRPYCTLVGHNIIGFDLPALQKLIGLEYYGAVRDTLLLSRVRFPDIRNDDFLRLNDGFPKELVGSHSLKAWGHRLGVYKGDAPLFDKFSEEMLEYCKQDVRVTAAIYNHINDGHLSLESIALEQGFARIIRQQEREGFPFDVDAAQKLHGSLLKESLEINQNLQKVFPPIVEERISEKTGKKLKPKVIEFNPASRLQIANRLIDKYGWVPQEMTPDGRPRVDEAVLSRLDYPEAKILERYLTISKRLGQLADGDNAWLRLVRDGRIHGRVNTNGAVTGRCTHSLPNMAQVPTDPSCRSLFRAADGMVLVGVDASGLELRCLAHFLGKYDGGAYARKVVSCDIHWENAKSFGLAPNSEQDKANLDHKNARNQAKGGIYALIYGAADAKLGMVLGGDTRKGRKSRANFMAAVPAFKQLKDDVERVVRYKGNLKGLDGRILPIRSQHAALNTLLQSAGAVVMKQACIISHDTFDSLSLDVRQVAAVHDEYQFMCHHSIADKVGQIVVQSIRDAGECFNFRCPLDGEYRVGRNWAETH